MQSTEFAFWLNGFFEISNQENQELSAQQVQIIKDHLALVFKKETPTYTTTTGVKFVPLSHIEPNCGYGQISGGIKLTDIKLSTYGDQYGTANRNDDIFPHCTGIHEMEKDLGYGFTNVNKGTSGIWRAKTLEDVEWERVNSGPVVEINPNTPVEVTQTYPPVQWVGPQVSC